jgi:hypothetical protein
VFVQGGSAANLSALVVARSTARRAGRRATARAVRGERADALVGREHAAHHRRRPARGPAVDDHLTGDALEAALAPTPTRRRVRGGRDARAPPTPGSSTTSRASRASAATAALDARRRGLRRRGAARAERARAFAGIEHADSLVVDPHKWLYAPFDCAALLYRDPRTRARCTRRTRRTST